MGRQTFTKYELLTNHFLSENGLPNIVISDFKMAAAAAEELTQNIRDQFLCCKICLDGLKLPKTLPCLHTFCADCIGYYIEHNRLDSRKFCCPICRRQIYIPKNGVQGFPDSFFVASLSDIVEQTTSDRLCGICKFKAHQVEAALLCVECKTELCEECGAAHHTAKVTEGHTLLPLEQGSSTNRENYCRIHRGETIKYYCVSCNSPICLPCTFLDHKAHEIKEIKDVRSNFTADMAELVLHSKDGLIQLTQSKADLVELENELFLRKDQNKREIRRGVQDAIRAIQEQEAELISELDSFYNIVNVGRDRQKLERTIYRLERAHDFAEQLMSSETSPITQLVNRAEAKESLQQALIYELPDITVHSDKLDNYAYFLPGKLKVHLGSLLKCCSLISNTVSALRATLPSTRAVYLHTLRVSQGSSGANLGEVVGLAFLKSGELAVLLSTAKKVKIFDKRGKLKFEFGDDDELMHPSDIAVTRDGKIAVADCGLFCIQVFDVFGCQRASFGGPDVFQLPISLTIDHTGKFLVCDQVRQRITIHHEGGDLLKAIDINEIQNPQYICCHSNMVFICDSENNVVAMYSYRDTLQFITKLTTPSSETDGQFLDCSGVCTDHCGNLFISDLVLDRLHMINVKGDISRVVSSGKTMLRPSCTATSIDSVLAVAQQGVDTLDTDGPNYTEVCVYRMVRADL